MLFQNIIFTLLAGWLHFAAPAPAIKPDSGNELEWNETRKLTWNDFSGKTDDTDPLHAMTTTNIDVKANCKGGVFTYQVRSVFVPGESWSKNKESVKLLDHEQQHFNITEIHARLMRKRLSEVKDACGPDRQKMGKVIEQTFDDWKKMQDKYDHETNHGLVTDKQQQWAERISQQLGLLVAFK